MLATIGIVVLVVLALGVAVFLAHARATDPMALTWEEYKHPSHPEDLTNFFRAIVGKPAITPEVDTSEEPVVD